MNTKPTFREYLSYLWTVCKKIPQYLMQIPLQLSHSFILVACIFTIFGSVIGMYGQEIFGNIEKAFAQTISGCKPFGIGGNPDPACRPETIGTNWIPLFDKSLRLFSDPAQITTNKGKSVIIGDFGELKVGAGAGGALKCLDEDGTSSLFFGCGNLRFGSTTASVPFMNISQEAGHESDVNLDVYADTNFEKNVKVKPENAISTTGMSYLVIGEDGVIKKTNLNVSHCIRAGILVEPGLCDAFQYGEETQRRKIDWTGKDFEWNHFQWYYKSSTLEGLPEIAQVDEFMCTKTDSDGRVFILEDVYRVENQAWVKYQCMDQNIASDSSFGFDTLVKIFVPTVFAEQLCVAHRAVFCRYVNLNNLNTPAYKFIGTTAKYTLKPNAGFTIHASTTENVDGRATNYVNTGNLNVSGEAIFADKLNLKIGGKTFNLLDFFEVVTTNTGGSIEYRYPKTYGGNIPQDKLLHSYFEMKPGTFSSEYVIREVVNDGISCLQTPEDSFIRYYGRANNTWYYFTCSQLSGALSNTASLNSVWQVLLASGRLISDGPVSVNVGGTITEKVQLKR